jgi:hypothetical protein
MERTAWKAGNQIDRVNLLLGRKVCVRLSFNLQPNEKNKGKKKKNDVNVRK